MGILRGMSRLPFYNLAQWQRARRQAFHDHGHQCQRCGRNLIGLGKGAIVHHRKELKRAPALRIEPANLQPLCIACHNSVHAEMKSGRAKGGCDERGFPLSEDHPWYRKQ
jgi:5-methylcytosine-specific restriction endonuclease McrA